MHTSTFFFAAIAALAGFAAATPPACLLAAVQEQPNPADLKALCGTLESAMAGNITDKCSGSAEAAAISVYSATCLAQGVTVSVPTATGTKTGSSASATGTSGGSGVDSPGSSTTGTAASPSSTKNAAVSMSLQSSAVLGSLFLGIAYLL